MKTEINLENKAKLFAQYWSQSILTLDMNDNYPNQKPWFDFVYDENYNRPCYLSLKPLSSITDEDAKYAGISKARLKQHIQYPYIMTPFMTDYLRSKGYALPWMGLSVEEMVEAGWIKLLS